MKIGIIGLPQTGKKTLFEILTQTKLLEKDLVSNKAIKGIAEIKDTRFDKLVDIYNPKKQVRARIEIELLPKITHDVITEGDIFKDIAGFDAICHIVRAFKNEFVYHINGSINASRDIDIINSELILNDLLFIEKRLQRIDKSLKAKREKELMEEKKLLSKLKEHLNKELPLRLLNLTRQENKIIASYPFVTRKKIIIVLNVSEEDINNTVLLDKLKQNYKDVDINVMQVSAKVESEIAKIESEREKKEFLEVIGIKEPAVNILTRLYIKALNLISFFTVGPDEVRQWIIKTGSSAPEAAGVIHSDMQRGFIRAEVIKYSDLIELGDEKKIKEAGKFYIKGKDYIIEDGDIVSIRFNV